MSQNNSSHRGFTLAELVVCTAILGMGFVFATPALNKGRAGTDRIRCENNLRQLSQAMLMYANNNGGLPPMAYIWPGLQPARSPGGWYDDHGWYSLIGPYIGEPAWAATINLSRSLSDTSNLQARR